MSKRWLIAAAILAVSFGLAYWGGLYARRWGRPSNQAVIDGLMIPISSLDFGEVWEEESFIWRLPIQNVTSHTIEIRKFHNSCGCTKIEPSSLKIPPGATVLVNLTIDLTHRSHAEREMGQRPFTISVQAITPSTRRGPGWEIHGTVRSCVTLDAKTVHFGEQPIHGQPAVIRHVLATVHVPCQRLEVAVNPLVATAKAHRREDAPERFEIRIAANPELPPGNFQTVAKIRVVGPNGERTPACMLPIAGEMQPEVRLLPGRVLLPPTRIGETAEAVVTLQAPLEVKVAVDHIEIDDPSLRVEPAQIEGIPAGRAYRLLQKVTRAGEQTNTARFFFRKTGQKILALPVEVCFHGESVKNIAVSAVEGK